MRVVYPGSFNPWHEGHDDVLNKALQIFSRVTILQHRDTDNTNVIRAINARCDVDVFTGFLADYVKQNNIDVIVRGIRNPNDMIDEQANQYWNEDLGIKIPTMYFISARELVHISSSGKRAVAKINYARS